MMSYFSAAWHSMTHSTPQMVFTMIQLVALSVAGQHVQANETSYTHWNLVSRGEKSAATNTGHDFFFPPWITFKVCDAGHLSHDAR